MGRWMKTTYPVIPNDDDDDDDDDDLSALVITIIMNIISKI
jgi:hypothetical protein